MAWIHEQSRRMLNGRSRSMTWNNVLCVTDPTWIGRLIIPTKLLLALSYALIVIHWLCIAVIVYPTLVINLNVHRFRVEPLSIRTCFTLCQFMIASMFRGQIWSGSGTIASDWEKLRWYVEDIWATIAWNYVGLMLLGTRASCNVRMRISWWVGEFFRKSKMEICARFFPKYSRMFYYIGTNTIGATLDVGAPSIDMQAL